MNPYTLKDDHPTAVLRMTYKAMEECIIEPSSHLSNSQSIKSAIYLRKVWERCMIRRAGSCISQSSTKCARALA
jgi:hypothetical protein